MEQLSLRLRRQALADIAGIRKWYRKIDPALEVRFVRELNAALDRIQRLPFTYQAIYGSTRRGFLEKFPNNVFYVVRDSAVVVVAVLHQKRDPALAQLRTE